MSRRDVAWVLLYTAAFVSVTLVGFAPLPRRVARPLQRGLLRPAAWADGRIDWAAQRWVPRTRRALGTHPRFRAVTGAVLDDAISETNERAGYAGTVDPPTGEGRGLAWLERRLADVGFQRNPTAYLEYRERGEGDEREFEAGSWALRAAIDADHQLHLRLFTRARGAVDVYAHWEPSVTAGAGHYDPPDYRTGVATTLAVFEAAEIPLDRSRPPHGGEPEEVTARTPEGLTVEALLSTEE